MADEKMMVSTNALNKTIQENLATYTERQVAKAERKGVTAEARLVSVPDLQATFCNYWPKARSTLNMALGAVGFFFPAQTAIAKAVLTAIHENVYKPVCNIK